ncbi:MAG: hypothetical protein PVI01_11175 [Gemmatimonadales bacterium]|jgi:hypothetical protein
MATYQLRPLSIGEILDAAFGVYRRIFGTLVAIAVICKGLPAVIQIYIEQSGGVITAPWLWLVAFVLGAVGGLIAAGATLRAISETYLGAVAEVTPAIQFALRKAWRLFVAGLAAYLLMLVAALFFVIPGIIVACGYAVVPQVAVLEDELPAPTNALGRSWHLTKGFKWRAFGLYVIALVVLYIPFVAAGMISVAIPGIFASETASLFLSVGAQLFWLVLYPVFACILTLFYYDLRVRKEGFDLEHLARHLGIGAGPSEAAGPV